ncbi:protein kinase domain-containing protein 32 [Elsinoe australis]|uniref:non-specific serine/threonine protein kinase n=1 Tax=Elsinoe australis TaxID=40998 RepID=A0A4V6DTP7_9PEZI|nr:protein kinase domain-containing protein 32 [Elsinoe australis]
MDPYSTSLVQCITQPYFSSIPVEPLSRYHPGGYHPVHIGDKFSNGKYSIAHKLGWGSYSTVWLAQDHINSRLVSLKILTAELGVEPREAQILKILPKGNLEGRGNSHVSRLLDRFTHKGPNGTHACLVFDVDSVSVSRLAERYPLGRLPGWLAWEVARQIVQGVSYLHSRSVVHGDLYPGNVMLSSLQNSFADLRLLDQLPRPVRADVHAHYGHQLTKSLPIYVVDSINLPIAFTDKKLHARLIDFGQSFTQGSPPSLIFTPLVFRAPELLLDKDWDCRIDIWALACTIFNLVTGQPPFDSLMPTKEGLVREWIATFGALPEKWSGQIPGKDDSKIEEMNLSDWLRGCYFESEVERKVEFAEEHIEWLGDLLERMMRYRPEERIEAHEVLKHKWFERNWLL